MDMRDFRSTPEFKGFDSRGELQTAPEPSAVLSQSVWPCTWCLPCCAPRSAAACKRETRSYLRSELLKRSTLCACTVLHR